MELLTKLGPGIAVIQAKLQPVGAQIAVVTNGLIRLATAWGHHAIAQRYIVGSSPVPM